MITLNILFTILLTHFIADFVFQSRVMGKKKSTNLYWLSNHVLVYSLVSTFGWFVFLEFHELKISHIINSFFLIFITHWITDFFTSKGSSYCYLKIEKDKANSSFWEWVFWAVIGIDQFIHAITLFQIYLSFK